MLLYLSACNTSKQKISVEERAVSLGDKIICPVCPSETINQSSVELSKQMRTLIIEQLSSGWTEEQILDFFVDRYGPDVLAAPPTQGFPLVAWTIPPVVLATSLLGLFLIVRSMRRRKVELDPRLKKDLELEPYLKEVDMDLGLSSAPKQCHSNHGIKEGKGD
jgi:cytochrome c-type biogenesis protein CcmH